jgi:hypothetical protein
MDVAFQVRLLPTARQPQFYLTKKTFTDSMELLQDTDAEAVEVWLAEHLIPHSVHRGKLLGVSAAGGPLQSIGDFLQNPTPGMVHTVHLEHMGICFL